MAIEQSATVQWVGGFEIKIDENTYPLYSAKLFGESQDAFRLGGEMAIISIGKGKKAKLIVDGEEIAESK